MAIRSGQRDQSGYALGMALEREQFLNDCGVEPVHVPWNTFVVMQGTWNPETWELTLTPPTKPMAQQ